MSKRDDGGPAFPVSQYSEFPGLHGMTLRDWFAGMALQGMLSDYETVRSAKSGADRIGITFQEQCANMAYESADAMLEARNK